MADHKYKTGNSIRMAVFPDNRGDKGIYLKLKTY